jgi:hypothetical protein
MAFLDDELYKIPVTSLEIVAFLTRLWSSNGQLVRTESGNLEVDEHACQAYLTDQCNNATYKEDHISSKTHRDTIEIVDQIFHEVSKEHIMQLLSSRLPRSEPEEEKVRQTRINNSVDLAARLVSMMDIGTSCCGFSGREPLIWEQGSLKDFISARVNKAFEARSDIKLEKFFNCQNLERIGGMVIDWTSNLDDHLRVFSEKDTRVAIFHHASFLKCQER